MSLPVAIDCEMVTCIHPRQKRRVNLAGQVTIVDVNGDVLLHTYVKPTWKIISYNTKYSGITPAHLKDAPTLDKVGAQVSTIIAGRNLVGFAVHNDLMALRIHHPQSLIIDMQQQPFIQQLMGCTQPSLKKTTARVLGRDIQNGAHSSMEDAVATMDIFNTFAHALMQYSPPPSPPPMHTHMQSCIHTPYPTPLQNDMAFGMYYNPQLIGAF